MVSSWWILRQEAGFRIHWGAFGKALLASLAMAMFLEALSDQSLITLVLIGSIIYFVCIYLLRVIRKEDILELVRLKS